MDRERLISLLRAVSEGSVSPDDAALELSVLPYRMLSEGLCLDTSRLSRTGQAEVVFAQSKSPSQLRSAVASLAEAGQPVLATRVSPEQGEDLAERIREGVYYKTAGLFVVGREVDLSPPWKAGGEAIVVSAGAADAPVALEALGTALFYGLDCGFLPDVGVAGLHRLLPHVKALSEAGLLIVAAGMEGALPSVLAGLTGKPVIAVPTSVGYGAGAGGLSALLAMLNSCSPGVAVVNIDNGYGAGAMAAKLLRGE